MSHRFRVIELNAGQGGEMLQMVPSFTQMSCSSGVHLIQHISQTGRTAPSLTEAGHGENDEQTMTLII